MQNLYHIKHNKKFQGKTVHLKQFSETFLNIFHWLTYGGQLHHKCNKYDLYVKKHKYAQCVPLCLSFVYH